jgi:putative DNA primase/helicase
MFKRTTGGDPIECEVKGSNKFLRFIWDGKHWFDANDLPKVEGDADTDAFYNRLIMVTFTNQIPKDKIDKSLPEKLKLETSGILNWMLDGLDRLEENKGFTHDTDIEEIKEQYKRASDTVYSFSVDYCVIDLGKYAPKEDCFRAYRVYCIKQGFSGLGRSTFYSQLQGKMPGITSGREVVGGVSKHVWKNLRLKADALVTDAPPTEENIPPPLIIY